jgi:hypothetical protein
MMREYYNVSLDCYVNDANNFREKATKKGLNENKRGKIKKEDVQEFKDKFD